MLAKKDMRLDAVVELKVDPDILVRRIESRIEQAKLRGEPLRSDDSPDILKQRLTAYRDQTAPLVKHYGEKGTLRAVDGMASISDVAAAIGRALADAAFRPIPRKAPPSAGRGSRARESSPGRDSKAAAAKVKRSKSAKAAKPRQRAAKKRQKTSKTARPRRLTK
jgi:adenylate kinase